MAARNKADVSYDKTCVFGCRRLFLNQVKSPDMKSAFLVKWMLLLPALAAVPGCVTHALWQDANLGTRHQPAEDSNLRLFRGGEPRELLVLYQESSEARKSTLTRAYLLYQNERRIERQQPPKFVSIDSARGLVPVPVFPATNGAATSPPSPLFAVLSADKLWFTLYSSGSPVGSYALPVYRDGMGKVERIALTPLAATADLSIVGGAVAVVGGAIYGLARAGYNGPIDYEPGPSSGP
jgi:hypothetical protein